MRFKPQGVTANQVPSELLTPASRMLDAARLIKHSQKCRDPECRCRRAISRYDLVSRQVAMDWLELSVRRPGIVFVAIVEQWPVDTILTAIAAHTV